MKKILLVLFTVVLLIPAVYAQTQFNEFLSKINSIQSSEEKTACADSFMTYARTKGIPFIEHDTIAVFLYRGSATSVQIAGDFTFWGAGPSFTKISGTNMFYYKRQFERNARMDYKIIAGSNWILDPENLNQVPGGYGPNSELRMPDYVMPWEIQKIQGITYGTLSSITIHSDTLNRNYSVRIYLPPGYDTGKEYPSVYFQDGSDYLNFASAANILDNLIEAKMIEPVIGVFVIPTNRNNEYALSERFKYRNFFAKELVPYIDENYSTAGSREMRLVLGDSYGGNISVLIAVGYPELFGHLGIHSGAYQNYDYETGYMLVNYPESDIKIYSVWGSYEGSLTENQRQISSAMISNGRDYKYKEYPEGHSWGLWRATLDEILINSFPYEGVSAEQKPARILPLNIELKQNYPNPFNPTTTIRYSIPSSAETMQATSLRIYDILGKEVAVLVNQRQRAGNHSVKFNAAGLPGGVYFYELKSGGNKIVKKLTLLK